jgi:tripartite-type tricarboxylate transporter receptor subunit TctC
MLAFEALTGIPPMVHVPYAGAAPLIPQLAGGHMDLAAINVNDAIGMAREGKLRILAQAAAQRQREAPDVPTFRELGLDIVHGASRGIVGPPGLPVEVAERLERAFSAAMADEGFQREAQRSAMPLRPLTGAAYREMAAGVDAHLRRLGSSAPGGAEPNRAHGIGHAASAMPQDRRQPRTGAATPVGWRQVRRARGRAGRFLRAERGAL